jgi:uncharacterized membrane protein YoaT (DUF817 family)
VVTHTYVTTMGFYIKDFFIFGFKQAAACMFAGSFFLVLFISNHWSAGLPRYDFLFIAALVIQFILYFTGLETKDEVKVIFLFHLIGLVLELYQTRPSMQSWIYPEPAFFKLATVPLYSGFMYSAIGSYLSFAWKFMKVELIGHKSYILSLVLCAFIYINFFTNDFFYDFRWWLILAVFIFYWRTKVHFTVTTKQHSMPLAVAFMLIAFFIWIAENISTYLGAWQYPDQVETWHAVSPTIATSWFLMVIISFMLVAFLKHYKKDVLHKHI